MIFVTLEKSVLSLEIVNLKNFSIVKLRTHRTHYIIYKKERKHIETSALLCALAINGNSLEEIKKNLDTTFKKPISKSDKFLLNDVMNTMCPEIDNRKIFEN